jgi:hypothetical protein
MLNGENVTMKSILALPLILLCFLTACKSSNPPTNNSAATNATTPNSSKTAGPLPENGYKGELAIEEAPTKLRVGQKERILVKVRNASNVFWWARGGETNDRSDNKFYIAIGNKWRDKDGKLLTEMDDRLGISRDMKPGEEVELPLTVTAPQEPGEYILEVDLVQEQVAWFSDKGSPTAKTKVTVVR